MVAISTMKAKALPLLQASSHQGQIDGAWHIHVPNEASEEISS